MMAVIERKTSYQNYAKGRFQPNLSHQNYANIFLIVFITLKNSVLILRY